MTRMAMATAMATVMARQVTVKITGRLSTGSLFVTALFVVATLWIAGLSFRCSLSWIAASDGALRYTAVDGRLQERLARAQYFAGARPGSPELPDSISAGTVSLAERAFRQEPFAVDALTLLGIHFAANGDADRARKIIDAAGGLSKRSMLTSFWLIRGDVGRGDIAEALQQYDYLLRTEPDLEAPLLTALVAAVQNGTDRPRLRALLAKKPPWADQFWSMLAGAPQSLANGGELRASLLSEYPYDQRRDDPLLSALVRAGLFAEAEGLYAKIAPLDPSQGGNLLRNGQFKRLPVGAPLDWQTYATGEFGAKVSPDAGRLAAYSVGDSGGVVARQLVHLTEGSYRLSARLSEDSAAGDNFLSIHLSCQQAGVLSRANLSWSLRSGENTRVIEIPPGCQYFFLDIAVGGSAGMKGSAATVTDVSMRKS